jgi:hypothetical protein
VANFFISSAVANLRSFRVDLSFGNMFGSFYLIDSRKRLKTSK